MTSNDWGTGPTRPAICAATVTIREALHDVRDADPVYLSTTDKAAVLTELPTLITQLHELNYRVMACADDVAEAHAARNVGDFIAHHTHQAHGTLNRDLALARDLDSTWHHLRAALRDGRANLAQAREIARALRALPDDLDADVVARAEQVLVERAEQFGPLDLRRIGRRILDVAAPEIAEAVEAQRLADLERSAHQRQRLNLIPQGDGTTRITGLLTDHCANRLATVLNAFTNPRRDPLAPAPCGCTVTDDGHYGEACGDLECPGRDPHHGVFDSPSDPAEAEPADTASPSDGTPKDAVRRMSTPRRNAIALNSLLESLDPKRLPLHGGDATTVVVTIDFETLKNDLGTATLATARDGWHDRISAGEARRLACNAGILPAVLGGASLPLDLGRTRRIYSSTQRRALGIRHPYCLVENCRIPASFCEAHHRTPWYLGGNTDLDEGELLCSRHHHCIHDPRYAVERLPGGAIRLILRT